jgi:hypothetical protein
MKLLIASIFIAIVISVLTSCMPVILEINYQGGNGITAGVKIPIITPVKPVKADK